MELTRLKILAYLRISESKGSSVSIDRQRQSILDYCQRCGLPEPDFFVDHDESGGNAKRHQWQNLLAICQAGMAEAVITYAQDRLFRDTEEAAKFAKLCLRKRITLHFSSSGIADIGTPEGGFMYDIHAAFAKHYRALAVQRGKAWVAKKKAKGEFKGGKVPYGYTVVDGKLIECPSEQQTLTLVRDLARQGASLTAIAGTLEMRGIPTKTGVGEWQVTTVRRLLRRA